MKYIGIIFFAVIVSACVSQSVTKVDSDIYNANFSSSGLEERKSKITVWLVDKPGRDLAVSFEERDDSFSGVKWAINISSKNSAEFRRVLHEIYSSGSKEPLSFSLNGGDMSIFELNTKQHVVVSSHLNILTFYKADLPEIINILEQLESLAAQK